MPYALLHDRLPDLAEGETRSITILRRNSWGLPPKTYSLHEMYCDEEGCDCRRVFLYVVSSPRGALEAVIAFGWETRGFYTRWLGRDDPEALAELTGPALNFGSPQSSLAPRLLRMVSDVVRHDEEYVARLKRHYTAFKGTIAPARATSRPRDRRLLRSRVPPARSRPPGRGSPGIRAAPDRDDARPSE